MASEPLTAKAFDEALRAALDAEAARRRPVSRWTIEMDREIWRANQVLKLGARPISEAMAPLYPWATRNMIDGRLALMRKHGGPEGVPR